MISGMKKNVQYWPESFCWWAVVIYAQELCYHKYELQQHAAFFLQKVDNDRNTKHMIDQEGNISTADFSEVYLHSLQEQ